MKNILASLATALFGLVSCAAQTTGFKSLDVDEFEQFISNVAVVRLDVRTPDEYDEGHIVSAINIDVKRDDFASKAAATLPQGKTIAVYCRSGKRSKMAAEQLVKMGYDVVELSTGYNGWKQAGREVTREEVDLFVSPAGTCIFVHCIKHGTMRLLVDDKWIYVDPVTDKVLPATDYSAMPKADIILITHEHPDHLDSKAIEQLTKDGTLIVANPRSGEMLGAPNILVLKNGENLELDMMTLEAVPAYNSSPDRQQFHPKGRDNGYILTFFHPGHPREEGIRFYIAGDTEDIPELAEIKDIAVAFMPCNQPFTMTPSQLAAAARVVRPRVLFPYPYGQTPVGSMLRALDDPAIEVRIRQYQ